jgi:predicted dinucleotide-binding enzyme
MNIGITGTGMVGQTIGAWIEQHPKARLGLFKDAALHGDILFNATAGTFSLEALKNAGSENIDGKVPVDIANPLDFSKGFPPFLAVSNTDSLGEQIAVILHEWFGWKKENICDLGDITTARGTEMLLPIWVRLYSAMQSPLFNFHIAVGKKS